MAKGIKRRGCGWSSERTTRGGLRGSERDCSGKMSKLNWCEKVANDAAKWRAEKDDSAATWAETKVWKFGACVKNDLSPDEDRITPLPLVLGSGCNAYLWTGVLLLSGRGISKQGCCSQMGLFEMNSLVTKICIHVQKHTNPQHTHTKRWKGKQILMHELTPLVKKHFRKKNPKCVCSF